MSSRLGSNLNLPGERRHARQTHWGLKPPSAPLHHTDRNSSGFSPGSLSAAARASPDADGVSRVELQKETKKATLNSFAVLI